MQQKMIEILTLCEYASEHNGHLTIIDTFDAIGAVKFPWRAYFYVAAKINLADCSADYKKISLLIFPTEEPSKMVFETFSKFERPKDSDKINIVAGFRGLIFEHVGEYCFRVCLDDTTIAECLFNVILKEK